MSKLQNTLNRVAKREELNNLDEMDTKRLAQLKAMLLTIPMIKQSQNYEENDQIKYPFLSLAMMGHGAGLISLALIKDPTIKTVGFVAGHTLALAGWLGYAAVKLRPDVTLHRAHKFYQQMTGTKMTYDEFLDICGHAIGSLFDDDNPIIDGVQFSKDEVKKCVNELHPAKELEF